MSSAVAIGNDVVDLADPRCVGKAEDARFLARVLSGAERAAVAGATDPDLALWIRWAAKEAAFKAVTQRLGTPPVFEHAAFVVELPDPGASRARSSGSGPVERATVTEEALPRGPTATLRGVVRWREWSLPFRVVGERDPTAVHAIVSWPGEAGAPGDPAPVVVHGASRVPPGEQIPFHRFTERECRSLHSVPSAWVRIRARDALAEEEGVPGSRIEIVCDEGPAGRMPPRALVDGERSRWKVSLSHHGRWIAWALARPRAPGDP